MEKGEHDRERWLWWRVENLYTQVHPDARFSLLRNGRAWLYLGEATLGIQWLCRETALGVRVAMGSEGYQLSGHLACLVYAVHFHLTGVGFMARLIEKQGIRECNVHLVGSVVSWYVFSRPHVWREGEFSWRSGRLDLKDACSLFVQTIRRRLGRSREVDA
jgi:hypothetical protein